MTGPPDVCSLTVIVTSDCNLRCAYCYENARRPARMPWGVLRRALDLLLKSSRRRADIVFTGGEPLLEFPLIRRAVRYVEAHGGQGPTARFHLITNGTLLGGPEARFLADHRFGVQLSLDGVPAAQRLRGKDTFSALDARLDRLGQEHATWFRTRLSVNVTVLPQTIPFLADSIDYLLSKGVRDILLTPALGHQRVWHRESIHLLDAQIAKVSRSCRRHLRQTGRVPVRFFRRRESPRQRSEPSTRLCGAGRPDYLTVDVDGGVFGCVLFARSYQRFPDTPFGRALATLHAGALNGGTLTDDLARSTDELDATGVFDHRPAKYSSYGRCGTCAYRSDCHVCPIAIVCQPGNADPNRIPDFVCAFYRVTAKYRRRFPELSSRRLVVSRVHQHQRRNQPAT